MHKIVKLSVPAEVGLVDLEVPLGATIEGMLKEGETLGIWVYGDWPKNPEELVLRSLYVGSTGKSVPNKVAELIPDGPTARHLESGFFLFDFPADSE